MISSQVEFCRSASEARPKETSVVAGAMGKLVRVALAWIPPLAWIIFLAFSWHR